MNNTISLGTLADQTAVKATLATLASGGFIVAADLMWAIRDVVSGEGPIEVGVAHGDYSVTELKEALEASASADPGDLVAREHARRLLRKSGFFPGFSTEEVLNDGRVKRTKVRFALADGSTLAAYAYNRSGAALTVGAGEVVVMGDLWVRF